MKMICLLPVLCLLPFITIAQSSDTMGIPPEAVPYPYEVKFMHTTVQQQEVKLAYMDALPARPNGRSVILFHGKNFPGAYWAATAKALTDEGYRVIIPDALGFGRSSRPVIQYSFTLLSLLNKQLLDTLGIRRVCVAGHSMGGMLAARFTLSYPEVVEKLVLEDPLGLEDWYAKGVPPVSVDASYKNERSSSYASILAYHRQNYYPVWRPEYEYWVKVQAGTLHIKNAEQYAFVSALTMDMIFTQPVLYQFGQIKCPVLVVVGNDDKTKVARSAPDNVMQQLGHYRTLGPKAAALFPKGRVIAYDGTGHVPHLQIPARFHKDLVLFLK